MPVITQTALVPNDLLRELHAAVLSADLQRDVLVEGLDRHLVAGFRKASSPAGQVWNDLCALNGIQTLADGSVPLRTWLETALYLAGQKQAAAVFRKALQALDLLPPPAEQASSRLAPPPAPPAAAPAPPAVAFTPHVPSTSTSTSLSSSSSTSSATGPGTHAADILIVTVLPEEYAAVLAQMNDARPAQGTADDPNTQAWRLGTIAGAGGTYRVALALVGGAGNVNAGQAVTSSVARWRPRYALLVGCAGGFSQGGCALGDVVVSTEVYGYELGKIDGGFHPRPNWTYQVDIGLRAGAQGFVAANPRWWGTGAGARPRVLFGPVAAGDKVVDDPSDPVFAAVLKLWPKLQAVEMEAAGAAGAIEHLRAAGKLVGFLIVRGISDMPRPPAERAAEGAQTGERDANKQRACEAAARFVARWIAAEWPAAPREAPDPPRAGRA